MRWKLAKARQAATKWWRSEESSQAGDSGHAKCYDCRNEVAVGEGYLCNVSGRAKIVCDRCMEKHPTVWAVWDPDDPSGRGKNEAHRLAQLWWQSPESSEVRQRGAAAWCKWGQSAISH